MSDEQKMLQHSVGSQLARDYSFAQRRQIVDAGGWSRPAWQSFAELGIPALAVPESHGGFGPAPAELFLVSEAFGRHLVQEPFIATVGAATALAASPANDTAGAILTAIAEGTVTAAFACGGNADASGLLSGSLPIVLHGAQADHLIVASGGRIWLSQEHVAHPLKLQDDRPAARITLGGRGVLVAENGGEPAAAARDCAIAMLCAEAAGAMAALLDMTLDYIRTREQFGVPVASFQALQHRAADMAIEVQRARAMALYAALALSFDADRRWKAVAAARVQVIRASRFVGRNAIQLHGGIGLTEENPAGHYYRRLVISERLFGSDADHLKRLTDAGGLLPPLDLAA